MHESNKFVSRRKVKSVKIKVGVERETGSARGGEGERWNCIDTDRESSGYSNVCVCECVVDCLVASHACHPDATRKNFQIQRRQLTCQTYVIIRKIRSLLVRAVVVCIRGLLQVRATQSVSQSVSKADSSVRFYASNARTKAATNPSNHADTHVTTAADVCAIIPACHSK